MTGPHALADDEHRFNLPLAALCGKRHNRRGYDGRLIGRTEIQFAAKPVIGSSQPVTDPRFILPVLA
jgi:hypothetical protein